MDETVKAQIDFLKDSLKIMNDTNYDSLRKIALKTIDRMEKQLLIQRVVGQSEQLGGCNFCNNKAVKRDEDGFEFCAKCLEA